jgi:hypothetical protein
MERTAHPCISFDRSPVIRPDFPAIVLQSTQRQWFEVFISTPHGCLIHDNKEWIAFIRADGSKNVRCLEKRIRFKQHVFDGHLFAVGISIEFADSTPEASPIGGVIGKMYH